MNPHDIRDMNWEEIQGKLDGLRARVHGALLRHGPCTTTALAAATGMSILTIRPRITELVQLRFAECVAREAKEGVYWARTPEQAMDWWRLERDRREAEAAMARQLEMKF